MARMLIPGVLLVLFSVAHGQFFYNYEDDRSAEPQPDLEEYDPSQYHYNPPSATNQQFLIPTAPRAPAPAPTPAPRRRTQGRSVRRYEPPLQPQPQPLPEVPVEREPEPEPEPVQEPARNPHNNRRTAHRRFRARYSGELPTSAPRVYSPSIFESIALGHAPSGVYIPHDSLLNVLKSPAHRSQALVPVPVAPRPVTYYNDDTPRFFVEPPPVQAPVLPPVQPVQPVTPQRRRTAQYQPMEHTTSRQSRRLVAAQEEDVLRSRPPMQSYRGDETPGFYEESDFQDMDYAPVIEPQRKRTRQQPARQSRRSEVRPQQDEDVRRRSNEVQRPRPQVVAPRRNDRPTFRPARLAIAELPLDTDEDGIPGAAGVDYPTLHVIPKTAFSCSRQQHNGYYADLETSCQVVHLCQAGGTKDSFLCPNGTIFNQEKFACQWWYEVNCAESPRFYAINDSLYKVPPTKN